MVGDFKSGAGRKRAVGVVCISKGPCVGGCWCGLVALWKATLGSGGWSGHLCLILLAGGLVGECEGLAWLHEVPSEGLVIMQ